MGKETNGGNQNMTTTKQSWFKRGLSAVLAAAMVLSMNAVSVFAAGDEGGSTPAPSYSTDQTAALCP